MTQMPELVAILHSLVGMAAVLVGFVNFMDDTIHFIGAEKTIHEVETFIGILIGAVTFSGSVIAFGKLNGKITRVGKVIWSAGVNLTALLRTIGRTPVTWGSRVPPWPAFFNPRRSLAHAE